jgi:hypothetical protein
MVVGFCYRLYYAKLRRKHPVPDDKSKTGKQDRDRIVGDQDYEVHHLAKEAGVTPERARSSSRPTAMTGKS